METGIRGKTYKIGQAAKLLDVKPFVLRFWESEFRDVLVPIRTPAGQRAYSEQNVDTVREIKRLLYDEGLTIEGAKKRLGQLHGKVVRAQIASPAPASPEDSAIAYTSVIAAKTVAAASASGPAGGEAEPESGPQAETLRATLREIRSELLNIRDLLGG
ncbi:MAG: MerR family transcriptional regulator [Proteobacteria bacterium]|nr:MerR family transcriptional regulator [Pseudomonadota bacterium]